MDQQVTGAKQRSYTEDHKRQVVDLVVGTGRTATTVATAIGVHPMLLCRWVRRYGPSHGKAEATRPPTASFLRPLPVPMADQAAEIARLRRENERLRKERDILKKSAFNPSPPRSRFFRPVSSPPGTSLSRMGRGQRRRCRGVAIRVPGLIAQIIVRMTEQVDKGQPSLEPALCEDLEQRA